MKHQLLSLLVLTSFQFANAQLTPAPGQGLEHVQLGQVTSAGTGCTAQDASPVLSIKNGKGSLTLSSLALAADASNPSLIAREACNVRVGVTVERGYQLGIRVSEVSGSVDQALGVKTTVTASASVIMKQEEQTLTQEMAKKLKGTYRISNKNAKDAITWTACSNDDVETMLALSANAIALRGQVAQKAKVSVKNLKFDLSVRACQ